jgi:hypothetical protein
MHPLLAVPSAVLLLTAVALPQAPVATEVPAPAAPAASASLVWPADRVLTDVAGDGTVWAAAGGWKAGFGKQGATFVPHPGGGGPSVGATFRLRAAQVAGLALPVAAAVEAARDGMRIDYERGGAVERYELRGEGIEQQFVLRELPARGDLVLEVAVATALACEPAGAGFVFVGDDEEDGSGIRYGAAVAIDAAGRRCDVATTWCDGALRLVVPGAFVAAAELPLLVDPLIGSATVLAASSVELSAVDLAYDHSQQRWYAVYERHFSATDHDVYLAWFDGAMVQQGLLTIDSSTDHHALPCIATLEAHDVACVLTQRDFPGLTPSITYVWRIDGAGPVVLQPVNTLSAPGVELVEPTIGGDADPVGPSHFLLGWTVRSVSTGASDLRFMALTGSWASHTALHLNEVGRNEHGARIGKTCGDRVGGTAAWAVAYRADLPGQPLGELRVAVVDRAGPSLRSFQGVNWLTLQASSTTLGSQWAVSSPTDHALGRRFLCAERQFDFPANRGAVVGHVFDRAGAIVQAGVTLRGGTLDQSQAAVDSDGVRFGVAVKTTYSATDSDVRCLAFGLVGDQLVAQDHALVSASLDRDHSPALVAARGGGRGGYGLAFCRAATAGTKDLRVQRYQGTGPGGVAMRATGCGGLPIVAAGSVALGGTLTIGLGNSGGLRGFVAGVPTSAPVAPCPGCTQGVVGATVLGHQLTVVVPLDAGLVGVTLAVQGFRFVAGGEPCLGQIELSDTVDFTVQ